MKINQGFESVILPHRRNIRLKDGVGVEKGACKIILPQDISATAGFPE